MTNVTAYLRNRCPRITRVETPPPPVPGSSANDFIRPIPWPGRARRALALRRVTLPPRRLGPGEKLYPTRFFGRGWRGKVRQMLSRQTPYMLAGRCDSGHAARTPQAKRVHLIEPKGARDGRCRATRIHGSSRRRLGKSADPGVCANRQLARPPSGYCWDSRTMWKLGSASRLSNEVLNGKAGLSAKTFGLSIVLPTAIPGACRNLRKNLPSLSPTAFSAIAPRSLQR